MASTANTAKNTIWAGPARSFAAAPGRQATLNCVNVSRSANTLLALPSVGEKTSTLKPIAQEPPAKIVCLMVSL